MPSKVILSIHGSVKQLLAAVERGIILLPLCHDHGHRIGMWMGEY